MKRPEHLALIEVSKYVRILFFLLIICLLFFSCHSKPDPSRAEKGYLDLSEVDFKKATVVLLFGFRLLGQTGINDILKLKPERESITIELLGNFSLSCLMFI